MSDFAWRGARRGEECCSAPSPCIYGFEARGSTMASHTSLSSPFSSSVFSQSVAEPLACRQVFPGHGSTLEIVSRSRNLYQFR